jgi:L-arabinose isomerase
LGRHERIPREWDRRIAAESHVRAGDTPSAREWLFEPGVATILDICDLGDRFRLVLNEVDVAAPDEPLPKLPVAWAVSDPKPDLATSAEWIQPQLGEPVRRPDFDLLAAFGVDGAATVL